MKQIFIVLFLSLFSLQLNAQELNVESFQILENDMDARTNYSKDDLNGKKAAIIKVVTTETGFTFDTGTTGIVAIEQKVGEIWVYVPAKIKKITIQHPIHGVRRDYRFELPIKEATVYEMKLITSKIRTIVEEDAGGQSQHWRPRVRRRADPRGRQGAQERSAPARAEAEGRRLHPKERPF